MITNVRGFNAELSEKIKIWRVNVAMEFDSRERVHKSECDLTYGPVCGIFACR